MAKIKFNDLPDYTGLEDHIRLKHGIHMLKGDGAVIFIDPSGRSWCGISEGCKKLVADLISGRCMEELIRRHGDSSVNIIDKLASRGLLEGMELPEPEFSSPAPCESLRHTITIAGRCNLACIYCSSNAHPSGPKMTEKTLYNAIDAILAGSKDGGYDVHFGGGEPLLAFDLIQKAARYAENVSPGKIRFSIQTNGSLLDANKVKWLSKAEFWVGVSIDGPAEVQNIQRPFADGEPSFERVINGIRLLREAGMEFHPLATLTRPEQFNSLYDFVMDYGIDGILARIASTGGRHQARMSVSLQKELAAAHLEFFDKILNYFNRTGTKILEVGILKILDSILLPPEHVSSGAPCVAATNLIAITPNGSLYPCDAFAGVKKMRMGSVNKGLSVEKIISHSHVSSRISKRNSNDIPVCSNCALRLFCKGGRTCGSYNRFGNLNRESDHCSYNRSIIHGLMIRVAKNSDTIAKYKNQEL